MLVKEICNYDEESQEADIIISDDHFDLLCYSHPFYPDKKTARQSLTAFMTENVMRAKDDGYRVEKLSTGYYAYRLQGKMIDMNSRLVSVGNIVIELENVIPKDIVEGDYVVFTVVRIDY